MKYFNQICWKNYFSFKMENLLKELEFFSFALMLDFVEIKKKMKYRGKEASQCWAVFNKRSGLIT